MSNYFDNIPNTLDDLDEALNAPAAQAKKPVNGYESPRHIEKCPKCRGTGRFISYSGQDLGPCFKCKGAGQKEFRSSSEQRAQGRAKAHAKAAQKRTETAVAVQVSIDAFTAEHPAAIAWLRRKSGSFEFATSVLDSFLKFGRLTDGQLAAVERIIAKDAAKAAERAASAPAVDATKIENAFAVALEKANRVGQMGAFTKPLRLTSPDKVTLSFRPGSVGSQWEGMLFAKSEDGKKLGHIKNGKFLRRFECTDAEADAVVACASDPETAVVAYAKAWSRCGVCGAQLLNDVSIARGIGPICAEKFGW